MSAIYFTESDFNARNDLIFIKFFDSIRGATQNIFKMFLIVGG